MPVVFMTGSHPRHAFLARCLAATGHLVGLVVEERGAHVPEPPDGLPPETRDLFVEHFASRAVAEARHFPEGDGDCWPDVPTMRIDVAELNGPAVHAFLDEHTPTLLFSYGVHILSEETLSHVSGERWNIHGGLSPWYRGCITHFWPSYQLEPQMTGMTVHTLTQAVDGGEIVHQCVAPLVRGDGLHDLACRAVRQIGDELPRLVEMFESGTLDDFKPQTTTGRIWRNVDWRPAHLHSIYEQWGNAIVDAQIEGRLGGRTPKIKRQF